MTPRSLGLPTDTSHVAGGPVDLPSPHPITVQWTYSGYRLPTHAQAASRWIRVLTIVKRSSIVGPAVYCTVLNSPPARISMLDTEKFFRVSLTSLLGRGRAYPNFFCIFAETVHYDEFSWCFFPVSMPPIMQTFFINFQHSFYISSSNIYRNLGT